MLLSFNLTRLVTRYVPAYLLFNLLTRIFNILALGSLLSAQLRLARGAWHCCDSSGWNVHSNSLRLAQCGE